jgi:hypothetical protein
MKIANIILSILIFLLAATSAVFSYFLFEKRSMFITGWDKMAKAINANAIELDKDSGTTLAKELTPEALSHEKFDALDNLLPKLTKQSKDIINQRNFLGEGLQVIGRTLGVSSLPTAEKFRSLDTYAPSRNIIINAANKTINDRNKVYGQLATIAKNQTGVQINVIQLRNGNTTPLTNLDNSLNLIKKRRQNYESNFNTIASYASVQRLNTAENAYPASAKKIADGVRKLRDEKNQAKNQLTRVNNLLRAEQQKLKKEQALTKSLRGTIASRDRDIASYKKALGLVGKKAPNPWSDGSVEARKKMTGKIVEVNKEYGYVVLDLGSETVVIQQIGNRRLEVDPKIHKGMPLMVARGDLGGKSKQVGRVVIDEVGTRCCIANIVIGGQDLQVGDSVYWAQDKAQAK